MSSSLFSSCMFSSILFSIPTLFSSKSSISLLILSGFSFLLILSNIFSIKPFFLYTSPPIFSSVFPALFINLAFFPFSFEFTRLCFKLNHNPSILFTHSMYLFISSSLYSALITTGLSFLLNLIACIIFLVKLRHFLFI